MLCFYSCQEKRKSKGGGNKQVNTQTLSNQTNKLNLENVLVSNKLKLIERNQILPSNSPLKITTQFELIAMKDVTPKNYWYEKWSSKNDDFEIWTIDLGSIEGVDIIRKRLDSLCHEKSVERVIFQKNFRSYKFYGTTLKLFKHEFFSLEKTRKYESLIDYLNKDFTCW
jgi:hypothetical protein